QSGQPCRARGPTAAGGLITPSTGGGKTGGTTPATRPAPLPRGAVPRPGRRDRDPTRDGLHRGAGPVFRRPRRLPPLRHGGGDRGRDRAPDVLPARPREPDAAGLNGEGPPRGDPSSRHRDRRRPTLPAGCPP